jgi:hypothetical protein
MLATVDSFDLSDVHRRPLGYTTGTRRSLPLSLINNEGYVPGYWQGGCVLAAALSLTKAAETIEDRTTFELLGPLAAN